MNLANRLLVMWVLAVAVCPVFVFAQKVKVDYDKSIEFEKFKTYTWGQLGPAQLPLLRVNITGAIDEQLAAKGLVKVETNPDVVVTYVGALAGEANQGVSAPTYPGFSGPPPSINSTMWTGSTGSSGAGSVMYPKGSLVVELMDPHAAKIAWRAVGHVKLDMEKKTEAFSRVDKLITKMFVSYPPAKK